MDFQYVIAIDFEATCEEIQPRAEFRKAEIIEFPAVLFDLRSGDIKDEFHEFIKPVEKPSLSNYCKQLTGITQETVNKGILLHEALKKFGDWLKKVINQYNLILPKTPEANRCGKGNCAFLTWSDCDLEVFLTNECSRKSIQKPNYFNQWINLQELYSNNYGCKKFQEALMHSGIYIQGNIHSGIDDARNTARLLHRIIQLGKKIRITKDITPGIREIII